MFKVGYTPSNFKNITGKRFGLWTVIKREKDKIKWRPRWKCICDCGTTKIVLASNLLASLTNSCGCAKYKKPKRICSMPQCEREHYGKGLCYLHLQRLPEYKEKRAKMAKIKDKTPKRKEQKRINQMKYSVSPKAILSSFHRWAKKKNKPILVTDDEILKLRENPCNKCGRLIEGQTMGFVLVKSRGAISLSNMLPSCGLCKLIKPKEQFDPIKFSMNIMRRFWKRTPMVTMTFLKARRSRGKYECATCKNIFKSTDVQTDHIIPVVDIEKGFESLDKYAIRLFCSDDNLQILCKSCHSVKTVEENRKRRDIKKEKKNE